MYIVETLDNLIHQTAFFNLELGNYAMIVVALYSYFWLLSLDLSRSCLYRLPLVCCL